MINKIVEVEAYGCLFRIKVAEVRAFPRGFGLLGPYLCLVDDRGEITNTPFVYSEGLFYSDDITSWTLTDRTTLLDEPVPSLKAFLRFHYKGEKDTRARVREVQVLKLAQDGSYIEGIDQMASGGFKRFLVARIDGAIQTVLEVQ